MLCPLSTPTLLMVDTSSNAFDIILRDNEVYCYALTNEDMIKLCHHDSREQSKEPEQLIKWRPMRTG